MAAKALEGLAQLTANRPATQHQQALRAFAQGPDVVRGQRLDQLQAGQGRYQGASAAGDDDGAAGQGLTVDLDRPWRGQPGIAGQHLNPQAGVTFGRVVGLNGSDHPLHTLHHRRKIHLGVGFAETKLLGFAQLGGKFGRAQQGFGGHAAGVQAVAAELVFFDQADLGLYRRGNVGADQAGTAAADHQQVAFKALGFAPALIHTPRLQTIQQLARQQRKHPEQGKGAEQAGGEDAAEGVQLAQLAAGIHINQGAGQHAELADPPEGARRQLGQAHGQVDQKKRKHRHQTQGKQVKGAVPRQPGLDSRQALAEVLLHPVLQ